MANSRRILKFLKVQIGSTLFAVGLGFFASGAPAQVASPLFKPGTEVVTGDRKLEDPLFPYGSIAKPELALPALIKETEGCKTLQSWEPTIVSRDH